MAKNLLIVESPAKWKTIEKFLWSDYKVVASMGHIRDLPWKELWIDIKNWFELTYKVSSDKKKTVDNLKKLASSSKEVWIATDEDREGEAIWWHICNVLDLDPNNTKRIVFHEITKKAILESIKSPRNINIWLVDAQQARRALDRLVWYKISPVLWKKIRKWLSAWRVQSVAVKLIVEKQREIDAFKPEEQWKLLAKLSYNNYKFNSIFSKLNWKIKNLKTKEDVYKILATNWIDISNVEESESKKNTKILNIKINLDFELIDSIKAETKRIPQAPFITSSLQQEAARKFNFWVKQTMIIAQKLYEWVDLWDKDRQGLITYMRTDSVNLSEQAKKDAKKMILKLFWEKYYKQRNYKSKSPWAQEAHEAIRPTDISRTPESLKWILDANQLKLYTLIWKRTLASQMQEAIIELTKLIFTPINNKNQEWLTKWELIKFDWFMKLYIESKDEDWEEEIDTEILPDIQKWEILISKELTSIQSFTKPPSRYTEASLVKKLESEWIWRPSTYAPTISTIIERWYIEKVEKRYLNPKEIAFTVNDFLEKYFTKMMEYKFTSKVEEDFDKIANWKETYLNMIDNFWNNTLKKDLDYAWETAEKLIEYTWEKCPKCEKDLIYKYSKWWKFIWCTWYPECIYTDQIEAEKSKLSYLKEKYEWKPCPEWIEWTIIIKTWRFWAFLASSEYPRVKWIWKIKDEKEEILEEILKEKGLLTDKDTNEELVIKNSKRWKFLAAKNYPEVKITKNIPKEVWDELAKRTSNN